MLCQLKANTLDPSFNTHYSGFIITIGICECGLVRIRGQSEVHPCMIEGYCRQKQIDVEDEDGKDGSQSPKNTV